MGLDISVYPKLQKLDAVFDADGEPIDPISREPLEYDYQGCINPDFPDHADGIEHHAVYKAAGYMGFRAGSYGSYNAWRNELARLGGYPERTSDDKDWRKRTGHDVGAWAAESGPFWELINFSDCEGSIGAKVSAKLAADFAEYDERAKTHAHSASRFYDLYQQWRAAFEMAADGGVVSFR